MAGYAGTTSFDFEIERYKNRETGKYIAYLLDGIDPEGFEYEYQVLTLKVEGRSYFAPGRSYGPPENCYPDEGETEILECIGPDGKDWTDQLTHSERESIEEQIATEVSEGGDGPDPDDYYDDRDD
jgi:hypothetical protein